MKMSSLVNRVGFFSGNLFLMMSMAYGLGSPVCPAAESGAGLDSKSVLATMHAVADWQLANPSRHRPTDWTQGAGYAGMMAVAELPDGQKYEAAMLAMGKTNKWNPGPRRYHADDHAVGMAYCELFFKHKSPGMIKPLQACFDEILAKPSKASLDFKSPGNQNRWSWCDALFMSPPAWLRLSVATGDRKYLDFMNSEWWATTDYLYDKEEQLYFRDSTYFKKREANGKKVFWGRGNGWVMGGLCRVLQYLPKDHPDRPRYETLYKDMAAKILSVQQPDGLWRASLLDPASYPLKETSSSGFFCFALAWGINNGFLDRAASLPAVEKAWAALVGCVAPDGKLTHVQPIGADPKKFDPGATEVYGVGAFLLAGTEVYKLAQASGPVAEPVATTVAVENPSDLPRSQETIEIPWTAATASVMEEGAAIPCQIFEEKLLFQADFKPRQAKTFKITATAPLVPHAIRAHGRHVPERMDDYAWENDRIAFRVYGPALMESAPGGEGLISSSVDVWVKRTRNLVIDKWYKSKAYHQDHGEGLDNYKCGTGRGCGGIGVWADGKLHVSANWATQKTLATGPIRTVAEFTYAPWDCGKGVKISETRRVSLDAGSNLSKFESVFGITGADSAVIAVGLDVSKVHKHAGTLTGGAADGFYANWEAEQKPNGSIGTAIVLAGEKVGESRDDSHVFLTAPAKAATPFVWYAGAGWSRSGDFADAKAWEAYTRHAAACFREPLKITVGNRNP